MYESQYGYEAETLTFGEKLKHAFNIFTNKNNGYPSGNSNSSDNNGSMSNRIYSVGTCNLDKYMITLSWGKCDAYDKFMNSISEMGMIVINSWVWWIHEFDDKYHDKFMKWAKYTRV